MGSEAVELVRRSIRAWRGGDRGEVVDLFAPEAEIDLRRLALPDTGVVRGGEALARWMANLFEHFPDLRFDVDEVVPRGEWVVARGSMRGRARMGGVEIEQPYSEAVLVRDGRIVRDVFFGDRDAAARWVAERAKPLLVAAPNVSEGRDRAVLERLEASVGPARVLDLHVDPDHNRAVLTL